MLFAVGMEGLIAQSDKVPLCPPVKTTAADDASRSRGCRQRVAGSPGGRKPRRRHPDFRAIRQTPGRRHPSRSHMERGACHCPYSRGHVRGRPCPRRWLGHRRAWRWTSGREVRGSGASNDRDAGWRRTAPISRARFTAHVRRAAWRLARNTSRYAQHLRDSGCSQARPRVRAWPRRVRTRAQTPASATREGGNPSCMGGGRPDGWGTLDRTRASHREPCRNG